MNSFESAVFVDFEDGPAAVAFAGEEFSVSVEQTGSTHRAEFFATDLLACLQVDDQQVAFVVDSVDVIANDDWRTLADVHFAVSPEFSGLCDVAFRIQLQREQRAHLGAVDVLFTVAANDEVSDNDRCGVNAAHRNVVLPDRNTG